MKSLTVEEVNVVSGGEISRSGAVAIGGLIGAIGGIPGGPIAVAVGGAVGMIVGGFVYDLAHGDSSKLR
jgi:hypothetical protein